MGSHDFSTFASRLHFHGELTFSSGLRIGASRSTRVDEPDLPVLRDAFGRPYIPGSSFKGALRSYIEAVLRALQAQPGFDSNLACLSVGKPTKWAEKEDPARCLTQSEVALLKKAAKGEWKTFAAWKHPTLEARVQQVATGLAPEARLDRALRDLSCWTCRVFGASWLASKVLIRDLHLANAELSWPADVRDGVAIDRDAGRAADGMKYQFEALAPGAAFELEILVENATPAELGLLWLGLAAFVRGDVQLGGARSRGLGWCTLEPAWEQSRFVDQNNLLDALFAVETVAGNLAEDQPKAWVQAFREAIEMTEKEHHDA